MNGGSRWIGWFAIGWIAWTAGCNRPTNDQYVPNSDVARRSLRIALDAWKAGTAKTQLDGQSPVVQFADSLRRAEQPLANYEIVAELPIDGGRRFEVELRFSEDASAAGQSTTETAQYVVLGIDPIWVIRQEDFDMVTHWDHPMPEAQTRETQAPETQAPETRAPEATSQPAAAAKDDVHE